MYESYYGLNSKPFQLTPDPAFFFASKWHKRAMSYLQYGLSQAEGFIVITGDIGTGKTTIANSLLADIEDDIVAAQIVTPKLSPDELVKMVAAKFEIDVAGKTKADILKDLEVFLFQLHKQVSAHYCWWTKRKTCHWRPLKSCVCCRIFRLKVSRCCKAFC